MDSNSLKVGNSTLQDGKYIITGVLGQGGFGITYEAEQVSLGRKVAIKEFFMKEYCERDGSTSRVSVPSSGSRELVERFRQKFIRESRMIASLNHPNIVKIYDVFEENGTAYYVMEHLPGGSISDKVRDNGALSEEQSLDYIRQASSALDYLHRRKTLHFDVKPSNILFDEDGRAVLIDFGISKHYDTGGHQTSSTPVGLSKGYAPLEQYRQDDVSTFTPATDIYSLGATLYYLATGTTPPDASIVYDEGLERPSGISDRLWSAIELAMQPRRKDRPQSIGEFLSLLDGKSGKTGGTADDTDDETTRMDAAAFHTRPESRFASASPPSSDSMSRQKTTPKQEFNASKKTGTGSGTNKDNITLKAFPKWLYGVTAALVLGLIVFLVIPKSKETPVPVFPVLEQTVTPTATPKPEPEPKPEPKVVAVTSITLNKSDLTLDEGATSTLTVKYTPTNATDKSTTWRSTNTKVATVNSSGKVTAVKAGSVAIIATCGGKEAYCNVTVKVKEQTSQTSSTTTTGSPSIITANNPKTGSVNGHEWVDLGLSVKWATCNVGASKPEDYGEYYAWGEISTKSRYIWENYRFRTSGDSNDNVKFSKYNSKSDKGTVDNKTTLDLSDDVARQKFGGSWRMPTDSEFQELIDNCTWTWVTQNGVNGFKVTSKKSGYMGSSIFLPAAGYRNDTSLSNDGYFGYYWSSSVYMSLLTDYAKYLNLYFSGNHFINYNRRCYGLPVRPVCP